MIQMQEILDLSVEERILLIEKIWSSIENDTIDMPVSHERELDRRLEKYKKGETAFVSWENIRSELNISRI